MGAHRPPAPERESRWWWPIMTAAVAGVVLPPVVWSAQHFAPHPAAAQTFTIPPEQVAEPSAHGGPLAPMSIGTTVTDDSAYGPDPLSAPRTAAGPRSGLSGGPTTPPSAPTGLTAASSATPAGAIAIPETALATTAAAVTPPTTTPTATTATTAPSETTSPSPTATTDATATTTVSESSDAD